MFNGANDTKNPKAGMFFSRAKNTIIAILLRCNILEATLDVNIHVSFLAAHEGFSKSYVMQTVYYIEAERRHPKKQGIRLVTSNHYHTKLRGSHLNIEFGWNG